MELNTIIYGVLISFVISTALCPLIIPFLHKLKFGQFVRDDGPLTHLKKGGTPTMGGVIILISFILTVIAGMYFFIANDMDALAIIVMTVSFGIIGFLDDYIKVVKKRSLGLRAKEKLCLQLLVTLLFAAYLLFVRQNGTNIIIPFSGGNTVDLGLLYVPFLLITVLGTVNGVNLTDGLDGLASGVTSLVAVYFSLVAWLVNGGVSFVSAAVVGSLLGFLLYNSYPARVFMGDTGSLALGGYVAATALLLKMPLFIVLVGLIYVIESLSVIIQVLYYKQSGGKRFFKMAPLHHHFELSNWQETKIVTLFYIITAVCCLIGYIAL